MSFSVAINLPPPTQKTFFITSDNSHCVVLNELGPHVGCRRVIFFFGGGGGGVANFSKFFLMNYHDW